MSVFIQNSRCPAQVLFAFDDIVSPAVVQVRWAVAYSTRRGCEQLVHRVSDRMGKKQWEKSAKQFVTSFDYGLTEPDAIEFLRELPRSTVCIANAHVIKNPGFTFEKAYHPKVYLFDTSASTGYIVGSANLTESALISNTEVVTSGADGSNKRMWSNAWDELLRDTSRLTSTLLDAYRKKWVSYRKLAIELDPAPPPSSSVAAGEKPIFWDGVATGDISPMDFDHFWIEAGSMSSGGSHNQLELPRGANRFFGFTHTEYGDAHFTIGHPTLTRHGTSLKDRPLTWHGNNKMERFNLPTIAQGGVEYHNSAVLFRRHAGGFEINVVPWSDRVAIAWRAASDELRTIFRCGGKGSRVCGLF